MFVMLQIFKGLFTFEKIPKNYSFIHGLASDQKEGYDRF